MRIILHLDAPKLLQFVRQVQQPQSSVFILTCNTLHGTSPFKFFWTKNGRPLDKSTNLRIDIQDSFSLLTIKNISLADTGNFSCSVQNQHGIDSQWSILEVKGWLRISIFSQNVALYVPFVVRFAIVNTL